MMFSLLLLLSSSVDWSLLSLASLSSSLIASIPVAVSGPPACAGSALVHSVPLSLSCFTMESIVVAHLSGLALHCLPYGMLQLQPSVPCSVYSFPSL